MSATIQFSCLSFRFVPSAGGLSSDPPVSVGNTRVFRRVSPGPCVSSSSSSPSPSSSSAVVLTGVQAGSGALQPAVSERRVLFGFESESSQAGVASVPVNAVGRAGRPVRTRRGRHGRVDPGRADPVQVADVVEPRGGHARHGGGAHPGSHGHGGDGVGRGEHGLRREGAHGVEECEVLGGERGRGQALVGPVVVGVGRVHVVVRLHEAAELGQVAVFAQVHLLVALPLPPLGPAVFKPHLEGDTHCYSRAQAHQVPLSTEPSQNHYRRCARLL